MKRTLLMAAMAAAWFGCSLCTEIETFYRGTRSGTLVIREEGGGQLFFQILPEMTGPWDERTPFSGGIACSPARVGGTTSQQIVVWLSPDDFATVERRCTPDAGRFAPLPEACAPGATDPQGRRTYELPTAGSVVSQIELLEP